MLWEGAKGKDGRMRALEMGLVQWTVACGMAYGLACGLAIWADIRVLGVDVRRTGPVFPSFSVCSWKRWMRGGKGSFAYCCLCQKKRVADESIKPAAIGDRAASASEGGEELE